MYGPILESKIARIITCLLKRHKRQDLCVVSNSVIPNYRCKCVQATSEASPFIIGVSNFINQKYGMGVESCRVCKVSQERDILVDYIYCKAWLDEISAIKRSLD